MADNLTKILHSLRDCSSAQSVFGIVDLYGKSLGFPYSILSACGRLLIESDSLPPFFTSAPDAWVARYKELDLYSIDPITKMVMRSNAPFTYAEAYFELTSESEMYRDEASSFGLTYGLAVPVHKVGMAPGVVSFASPEKIHLDPTVVMDMSMIGICAYMRASEFFAKMIPEIHIKLTDRERAILTLVARGKTNWEVGAVLSISEYSVRDYLKVLSRKLDTSNRTHTVARAMQLGLVVP